MCFSEFLETCTIVWVLVCEGGVGVGKESSFFILVGGGGTHHPRPGLRPHSPRVTPAHPDGLHNTGIVADRARCKADHATHRHTRPNAGTLHRSALDTRQAAPGKIVPAEALKGGQLLYHAYYDSSITGMVY